MVLEEWEWDLIYEGDLDSDPIFEEINPPEPDIEEE